MLTYLERKILDHTGEYYASSFWDALVLCWRSYTHTRGLGSGSEAGYVLDFFTEFEFFPFADTIVPKSLDNHSHIIGTVGMLNTSRGYRHRFDG